MRILVISDTHGNLSRVYKVINAISDKIDAVIHCGDIVEDVDTLKLKYPNLKFYNVRGNCDYGSAVPNEDIFIIGGKKFFVTHGDLHGVNWNIDRLCYKGAEVGADICLYGHTHVPFIDNYNGIVILNPGSLSAPRGNSTYSYGIIKIEDGVITPSIVEYK